MAQTITRQRIIGNPGRRRKRRSSNPGEILGFVFGPAGNPGRKKGGSMARARRRKRNWGAATRTNRPHRRRRTSSHRRRTNPGMRMMTRKNRSHRRRRHSNPGIRRHHRHHRRNPGMLGDIGPMFTNAVFVIVGALGSKLGAQAVLGTNNVGIVGYGANAAAGGIMWFLAEKVMKNRAAANGIIAGTVVQILLRIINDYTPFGSYVANLGMGDYQMQSFVTPQILVDPWRNADIRIPAGWGASAPMSATAGPRQMGGGTRAALPAASAPAAAAPATSAGVGNLYGGGMTALYG